MRLLYLAVAFVLSGAAVHACDGVSALSGSCYAQNVRQRVVVERVQKVQRVERVIKRQRVRVVRRPVVERVKIVERVRSY